MADLTPDQQIGAYAPGSYTCKCLFCGREFVGDKRELSCFDCAKGQVEAAERRQQEAVDSAAAAARAQIVGWLRFQEREWRDTSANLGSSVAGNVAAHYAQALHNAIESIESGAPERWAAEREGERG